MKLAVSTVKAQSEMVALFISDLHLHAALPRTTQAFFNFLHRHAMQAHQLYLLGDIFEYWAGDDDISSPFNQRVIAAIRAVGDAGIDVFWIAGNRDFLVGADFAKASGATLLPDPFVIKIAGQRITLTHGDAQCTDDLAYIAFRSQVREQSWQTQFLAMPLAQRKIIIEGLRNDSRHQQQSKSYAIMDVNATTVDSLLRSNGTSIMIHGHTHRPACHIVAQGDHPYIRYVLPDWECDTPLQRGGWIGIDTTGAIRRFTLNGTEQV